MALLFLQILTETIQRQEVILNKLHDITFYGHPKEEQNVTVHSPQYQQPTTTTFPKYQLNPMNKSKSDTVYSGDMKCRLFEGRILDGPVSKWSGISYDCSYSPNPLKTGPFEIRTFLSGFQMILDKMAGICPDFKLLGFWISDPI